MQPNKFHHKNDTIKIRKYAELYRLLIKTNYLKSKHICMSEKFYAFEQHSFNLPRKPQMLSRVISILSSCLMVMMVTILEMSSLFKKTLVKLLQIFCLIKTFQTLL